MRHWHNFDRATAMATRWRRRRICQIVTPEGSRPVALRAIDGRGAWVQADPPPPLGSGVELRHPTAGSIRARVAEIGEDGVGLRFDGKEAAIAFALAAIAADMTFD